MSRVPTGALVSIDGEIVPAERAQVSVFDRGFLYGDGVFEVTRTAAHGPLFLDEHLCRLERSGAGIGLRVPQRHELRQAVAALLQAFGDRPAYLRVVVTRGAGDISLDPAAADGPLLAIIAKPLALPAQRLYEQGAMVTVLEQRRNAPGQVPAWIKSGNYLSSVLAMAEVRRRGAYEGVLCDQQGQLAEGASSNLFAVRRGRVLTPPVSVGLLAGITRAALLGLCHGLGIAAGESQLVPADLWTAEEAFLTSSVRGVLPVVSCDGQVIGGGQVGPVTRRLMAAYAELIGGA